MIAIILDTETSSIDPATGHLVEVACAVFSVDHASVVKAYSSLVQAPSNEAESINGIPAALLSTDLARPRSDVVKVVQRFAEGCALVLAHNADFDREWLPELSLPWVCSQDDCDWPRSSSSRSLMAIAVAHGLGIASAHRALDDVMILARLLSRAAELGTNVDAMLKKAMRPKKKYRAIVSYDTNALARERGFRWSPEEKIWWRKLPPEDVPEMKLPFRVEECAA